MCEEAKLLLYVMKFFGILLLVLTIAWAAGLGVAVSNGGNLGEGAAAGVAWALVVTGFLLAIGWIALCLSIAQKVDYLTKENNSTKKEGEEAEKATA